MDDSIKVRANVREVIRHLFIEGTRRVVVSWRRSPGQPSHLPTATRSVEICNVVDRPGAITCQIRIYGPTPREIPRGMYCPAVLVRSGELWVTLIEVVEPMRCYPEQMLEVCIPFKMGVEDLTGELAPQEAAV